MQNNTRPNTVDIVADRIREGVLQGRFAPGQRLIETDLTEELNISRGPLREALRRLVGEGIVEIVHNRGAVVKRFTRKEIGDLFRIRAAIEGLMARLAAENIQLLDNQDRIKNLIQNNLKFVPGQSGQVHSEANRIFHQLLIDMADNPQLSQLVQQLRLPLLRLQIRFAIDDDYWRSSYDEHIAIAEAILAGDPDSSENFMKQHLINARDRVFAFPVDFP